MQQAKYARIYTDDSGESHLEDLDITLAPVDFAPPAGNNPPLPRGDKLLLLGALSRINSQGAPVLTIFKMGCSSEVGTHSKEMGATSCRFGG